MLNENRRQLERIIVFDDECVLCNSLVKRIIKYDSKAIFKFTYLKSKFIQHTFPELLNSDFATSSILLIIDNKLYYKSEAVLKIANELIMPIKLISYLKVIPTPLLNFGYNFIARVRYKLFGRTTSCNLLSTSERRRILE